MYTTKRIDDNSYPDIQTLYHHAFGSTHTIAFIKSKYATDIFGLKNVGVIAKDEKEQPAAYYGVFPIVLKYNSNDYIVAQSGDTMTAPNHRKKGLFTKLAKEAYKLSKDLGIRMVFGFPNENSYPGFKNKLNWIFTGYMYNFTLTVMTIPICELASKYKFLTSSYEKFAKKRLVQHKVNIQDVNWEIFDHKGSGVIGEIKKDDNFFKYKLNRKDTFLIKINGFTLLVKVKPHLYIGAVNVIDKDETKALISTVRKLSQKLGCKRVIFTLSENHWLYGYLKEYIEPTKSLPIGFYMIDSHFKPEAIQFIGADYDTF
jgi:GNAT superfamily N-acetyltransferase